MAPSLWMQLSGLVTLVGAFLLALSAHRSQSKTSGTQCLIALIVGAIGAYVVFTN
jgi:hypothetical protein